jgi:FMN phosphatase YigB (HAD superfamily)
MTRCKPSRDYYRELLDRLGSGAEECVMIGNDPRKDLPAKEVGITTFLVDVPGFWARRMLRRAQKDPRLDGWGTYADLRAWLRTARGP